MKMSPYGGVTRALDRACTTTLNIGCHAIFFECIAVADNEMGSVKEVEDGASEAGDVYIDRILLLL